METTGAIRYNRYLTIHFERDCNLLSFLGEARNLPRSLQEQTVCLDLQYFITPRAYNVCFIARIYTRESPHLVIIAYPAGARSSGN